MRIFYFLPILLLCACTLSQDILPGKVTYSVKKSDMDRLVSPLPPLESGEVEEAWAREFLVGKSFARDLDFYRAITAFKRALVLMPEAVVQRRMEVQYNVVVSYYCARKYIEVVKVFESSWLSNATETFPAYEDLLTILYESYNQMGYEGKAAAVLRLLEKENMEKARRLPLSLALVRQDIQTVSDSGKLPNLIDLYKKKMKSPATARTLSAIFPGAGYYYAGQKHTAITSFILNTLFITAAVHAYDRGDVALGIILTGFEAGWYFGGINGTGIAAQQYNHNLFSKEASQVMEREKWFPVLTLRYAF